MKYLGAPKTKREWGVEFKGAVILSKVSISLLRGNLISVFGPLFLHVC